MYLAPDLYKLGYRKKLTVKDAISNGRWMGGLQRMSTEAEVDHFLFLWCKIQEVQLSEMLDSITWNLTTDGQYSAASAYAIIMGLYCISLLWINL